MNVNKLSLIEVIAFIVIISINRLSINIPQTILLSCGSSSILNVIYISLIAILFSYILIKLFKRFPNSDILDVSEFLGGKFLKNVIGIVILVYTLIVEAVFLRDFTDVIHVLYYTDTPIFFLILFFIVVTIIANLFGKKSIAKTNLILCIIMIIGLLVSFLSVLPNLTVQRAFPILGYGAYQTFFTGLSNIFAFNGLLVLFFIPSFCKEKGDFSKATMIGVIISAILVILATTCILLAFSFTATLEKISPLYTILSNNEFGKYLQHPESLFVFTWIMSFMTYLNMVCMVLVQICKKLTNVKNGQPFIFVITLVIFIISLIPQSTMAVRDFGTNISLYFAIPLVFVFLPVVLILANIKHKKLNKSKS